MYHHFSSMCQIKAYLTMTIRYFGFGGMFFFFLCYYCCFISSVQGSPYSSPVKFTHLHLCYRHFSKVVLLGRVQYRVIMYNKQFKLAMWLLSWDISMQCFKSAYGGREEETVKWAWRHILTVLLIQKAFATIICFLVKAISQCQVRRNQVTVSEIPVCDS